MKQIYYAVIMLIRGKGSNAIKVVSLTLGLFVSILLFARVAFELSYNTGYAESEKLCAIMATYTIGEQKQEEPSNILFGPVTYAVRDAFPEEIVAATVSQRRWNSDYYLGDRKYELNGVMGDSLFFQTMGITLLEGNALDLASPDIVFLSEKTARELFGAESPVGKTLMHIKEHKMTIRGVFKPLEENNSLRPDVVMSFATGRKYGWGYYGWQGGDSYMGFVRLRNTSDIETINKDFAQRL